MPVIKTYFGFYLGVGGGEEYRAFIRSRLPPELKGGCESSSHGYLTMFVSKYFKNITLKMFTAYPFFS